ncbi:signal recognition particle protein Srp19 [Candidatus Bathyarchaeota archaeon]|nr:signal recognition particle protein Srp19 [Candidatus Bathyarchaeota archaeon]
MKTRGKLIIWPIYLDVAKTRREGRRLPKTIAVENPKLQEIGLAASALNLNPELKPDAAHPSAWWEKTGMILVDKKWSKTQTLQKLADKILEQRQKQKFSLKTKS